MAEESKSKKQGVVFIIGLGVLVGALILYLLLTRFPLLLPIPISFFLYDYLSIFLYIWFLIFIPYSLNGIFSIPYFSNKPILALLALIPIILGLPAVFCVLGGGGVIFNSRDLSSSINYEGKYFYVTSYFWDWDIESRYKVYVCNSWGWDCDEIIEFWGGGEKISSAWFIDEDLDTLYLVEGNSISLVYDLTSDGVYNVPEIELDQEANNHFIISVSALIFDDGRDNLIVSFGPASNRNVYLLSYAWYDSESCEGLGWDENCVDVIFYDEESHEYQIIIDEELVFAYRDEPVCYVEECLLIREAEGE